MKINAIGVTIGTEGRICWLCDYARSGGSYCELFRVRLVRSEANGAGPCVRCAACLEAEKASQPIWQRCAHVNNPPTVPRPDIIPKPQR